MDNISFFIPAYNCAKTITEAVDSIMETNFVAEDELIIVNDFSSDDTAGILKKLQEKYPAIIIIDHKRNKGGAAARNTAVENTKHEFLFCLDADNVLTQNSVRPMFDFMLAQNAEIVCFNELRYFSDTTAVVDETWTYEPGIFTIEDLLCGKLPPGGNGNYLFTKNSWLKANGYTEDLGALDTWAFGFKQLMENCKMVVMPGSYYFHRRGHESYYLRDAWNKRRSVSLRLIKLVINYIDRFDPADVNYIFSKKGRYTWFDNLQKRPVRLIKKQGSKLVWAEHDTESEGLNFLVKKTNHYKFRIFQIVKSYFK